MLHDVGAVVDTGTIFWDMRPSSHVPTLEVRMADVPTTAEETALLAALVRALAVDALAKVDAGDPGPAVPAEALRLAYWRAARDGAAGHGVDPLTGRLLPAAELAGGCSRACGRCWRTAASTTWSPAGSAGSWPRATARPGSAARSPRTAAWRTSWTIWPPDGSRGRAAQEGTKA